MRFLQHEHDNIQEAIRASGLEAKDFRSVKRQGKLLMFFKDDPEPFKFFRKKEMRIGSDGKWGEQVICSVYEGGKGKQVNGWEDVAQAFKDWLRSYL